MNIYSRDAERAIRVERLIHDWNKSGLITDEQRDRMLPDVHVDFRRTNVFLRATLLVFAFMIVIAAAALIGVTLRLENDVVIAVLFLIGAAACFAVAQWLITEHRFYRFGVEEAAAVASALFFVLSGWVLFNLQWSYQTEYGFAAATIAAAILFRRFGFVYAGVAAIFFSTWFVFDLEQSDTFRRLFAAILLLTIFFFSRERRQDHEWDVPADTYAILETTAWGVLYFITNLKITTWFSLPDDVKVFYWATYVLTWILPIAGLSFAIRDRHRWMLDLNIVMLIVTLSTNKPYLGIAQKPWDPIVFGVMLIVVSLGLRRWIASGANASRHGFVAHRLLESEKAKLALAGKATVLMPGAPQPSAHQPPPSMLGGGRSGGAGASGNF